MCSFDARNLEPFLAVDARRPDRRIKRMFERMAAPGNDRLGQLVGRDCHPVAYPKPVEHAFDIDVGNTAPEPAIAVLVKNSHHRQVFLGKRSPDWQQETCRQIERIGYQVIGISLIFSLPGGFEFRFRDRLPRAFRQVALENGFAAQGPDKFVANKVLP